MTLLEMAQELDGMERSVSSWEADFLESVLNRLRDGQNISQKQESKLRQIYDDYFGDGAKGDGDGGSADDDVFM